LRRLLILFVCAFFKSVTSHLWIGWRFLIIHLLEMKQFIRNMKNNTMFDPIEVKIRDATSSDPWGAPSTLLADIAEATLDYAQYPKLFQMLWKRLRDYQIHMHVQKALILVEYLLRNGSDRFVRDCQHRADDIAKLKRYKYYNKDNEDIAGDIRKKAKQVHDLLMNDAQLAQEREKAMQLRGVRSSHVSSREDPSPREERARPQRTDPARKEPRDAYDDYSDISKQEAFEAAVREEAARRLKAEETARKKQQAKQRAPEEPQEEPEPEEPAPAPAPRPKPKPGQQAQKPRPKLKPAPESEEPVGEEEEQQEMSPPPRLQQPAKPKTSKARVPSQQMQQQADPFDGNFAVAQDPFNPMPAQPQRKKNNVDAFLADALGGGQSYHAQPTAQPAGNVDFLTGAMESHLSFDDDGHYDDQQGGGGQVVWEPENEEEEQQQQQQHQQSQPRPGDVWGDLINLDNVTVEKKTTAPVKKVGKPMSEMAAKKGSVIMGSAIDGFEAPPMQTSPVAPGYGYPPTGAYGGYPAPGYGYPPMAAPMGAPMAAPMGAPMGMPINPAAMGPGGYPAAQQPRRSNPPPQQASNPFNW